MRLSVRTLENGVVPIVADSYEELINQGSKYGLPQDSSSYLTCNGVIINEEAFSLMQHDSVVNVNIDLLGGGKKRKKKQYTTPKKIKHKRKPNKKECTNDSCGAGIFMGNHFDRLYCGKCHTTYVENKG